MRYYIFSILLLFSLAESQVNTKSTQHSGPIQQKLSIDHVNVVVRDLNASKLLFEKLGFTVKSIIGVTIGVDDLSVTKDVLQKNNISFTVMDSDSAQSIIVSEKFISSIFIEFQKIK